MKIQKCMSYCHKFLLGKPNSNIRPVRLDYHYVFSSFRFKLLHWNTNHCGVSHHKQQPLIYCKFTIPLIDWSTPGDFHKRFKLFKQKRTAFFTFFESVTIRYPFCIPSCACSVPVPKCVPWAVLYSIKTAHFMFMEPYYFMRLSSSFH